MDKRYGRSRPSYFDESLNEENDNLILDLESKVHTLKNISSNMRDEILHSQSYINDLNEGYDNIRGIIGRNMLNMKRILKLKSTTDGMIKLVMMFFCIIILMYILYKIKK